MIVVLFASSCANISAPQGGPRDTEAPKLLNKSSVDSLLNFKGGKLIVEFDEYIKLDNLQKNFSISPLTKQTPKISTKKKTVIINLPDSLLQPNTTYNLDFGSAVQDVRERNKLKDLRITFSTGAYFDSLFLAGKIMDAKTGQRDSMTVMLYPKNTADSMILKERPLYVTKATGGGFSFRGLPNAEFKIAALNDKNSNYTYDALGEKIAFTDKVISTENPDSALVLYSFVEERMIDTTQKKRLKRKGNAIKKSGAYSFEPDIKRIAKLDYQDSLKIVLGDQAGRVNTDKIRFYENDVLDLSMTTDYDDSLGIVTLFPHWEMGSTYKLILQTGFWVDSLGEGVKADTLAFKTMSKEDYAKIVVTVDTALQKDNAILLLYNEEREIARSTNISKSNTFDLLKPESYTLRILYDENQNGQWDSGSLEERKQAEITIELPKKIRLKPNWENKIEWQKESKKRKLGKGFPTKKDPAEKVEDEDN